MTAYNITIMQKNSSNELDTFYPATTANQVAENTDKQFVSAAKKTQYDDNTVYTNETPIVEPVGQIVAGDTFDNVPVHTMLDKLLYPYVAPTLEATPSTASTVVEKGVTLNITSVTASVVKKSENITKIELYNGATLVEAKTDAVAAGGTFTFNQAIALTDNAVLKVKATDAKPTTIEAVAGEYTFVYPFYHGVVAAGATVDAAAILAMTKDVSVKGDKTYTYTLANSCAVIAYPKSYGALAKIEDKHGFDNLAAFTRSEVSVTGTDGTAQDYYVYVEDAATASAFDLTFKF